MFLSEYCFMEYLLNCFTTFRWTRENAPIYYATAVEVSKPYLELIRDLSIMGYNGLVKGWIAFDGWVSFSKLCLDFNHSTQCYLFVIMIILSFSFQCSKTAPDFTNQVKVYAAIAGDTTKQYAVEFVHYTKVGFNSAQDYAAKNIFV